jgi:hypothetical protein
LNSNTELQAGYDLPFTNQEIRVQIGDICCLIECHDKAALDYLRDLYGNFISDKSADIKLAINVLDRMSESEVEKAMHEMQVSLEGNRMWLENGMLGGEYNPDCQTISVSIERQLFRNDLEFKMLNRIIDITYNTGCNLKYAGNPTSMLVHSCGIIRKDKGLLFVGPPDVGKTTVANFCGDEHGRVLNDENILVSRPLDGDGTFWVHGVPIIGGYPQRLNEAAPLACILLLKQSESARVRSVSRLEAYTRFLRQVMNPAYWGQTDIRAIYTLLADFSDEVTKAVPCYELEFTLDKDSLWASIEELENNNFGQISH